LPDGRRVYLAYRRLAEIFRAGEPSISAAIRSRKASWALDEETLLQMRAQSIRFVGVLCRDNRDIWVTTLERFLDSRCSKIMNYEGRGGALQRYLPLQNFIRKAGRSKT
jgi:hypothetical protein